MSKVSDNLVNRVAANEGFRSFVYRDAPFRSTVVDPMASYLSIGYGLTVGVFTRPFDGEFLSEGVGLTEPQARRLLKDHLNTLEDDLRSGERSENDIDRNLVWSDGYEGDEKRANRGEVLVEMAYQMGVGGLFKFKRMWAALAVGAYSGAAHEMLDSRWAKQTPKRAKELAEIMQTGKDYGTKRKAP